MTVSNKKVNKVGKSKKTYLFIQSWFFPLFLLKGKLLKASERSCRRCGQFYFSATICVWCLATPLNKSGKGFKIFLQYVELLYPFNKFQTNWTLYREHTKSKHHFYCVVNIQFWDKLAIFLQIWNHIFKTVFPTLFFLFSL